MPTDLLIRNAHIIDPSQDIDGLADLAISDGVIAAVGRNIEPLAAAHIIEAAGLYLSPGLIDLHGHWYEGGLYGVNAEICLNHGVTTVIDAGTTGFANFPEFHRTAMWTSRVDILAFVHISCLGLHAPFAEELLDLRYARPAETAVVIQQHPGRAVGVKVRLGGMTADPRAALQLALAAAREVAVPVMVHISNGAPESEVLEALRPGDILTHCFHGRGNGMIDDQRFIPQVASARERGVIFDVGHGCGSFSWDTARKRLNTTFIRTRLARTSTDTVYVTRSRSRCRKSCRNSWL